MSIRVKYEEELNKIEDSLVQMGRLVEEAILKSVSSLIHQDKDLAKQVIKDDTIIDNAEHNIEQQCLTILLMEHPFANDFRDVSAALKMITDLERIGDQASDIAEITLQFKDEKYIKNLEHIQLMSSISIQMVKESVASYINKDLESARALEKEDDKVDNLFQTIKDELIELIKKNKDNADQAILFMMIAKYLERISDHATNIGEWVEYAITGYHKIG